MRLRVGGMACALALLGSVIAAGSASASPQTGFTIAAAPNPVIAGQGVLIYGQLLGAGNGGQTIRLFHHINGTRQGFSQIASTTSDPTGHYEFSLPAGLVYSNREWFVRGPNGSTSRTVFESVRALVSIAASTQSTPTNHSVVFTGHVSPNHRFQQVLLQQQKGSSDDWRTLRATTLTPGSNYFVRWAWRRPNVHEVRVVFKGDNRNAFSASDPVSIVVQQSQVPGFSINTSAPIVPTGSSVTISGVLDQPGSTTKPASHAAVQLWGHGPGQPFKVLADGVTGPDGSYSFNESNLTTNTIYYVSTPSMAKHSALLYQGVRDIVTMTTASTSANSGEPVTFTGTVAPDKSGRIIALQTQGSDGDWHNVELAVVQPGSTFQFSWTLGAPGTTKYRARITNDDNNIGSVSQPVSITATAPPPSSLPPAS